MSSPTCPYSTSPLGSHVLLMLTEIESCEVPEREVA